MASHQYVYVMNRLSKAWPGGKEVLKNISLSFLPGAKIGVLGLNGAGKSTLLKIMAGIETEFQGEAWAADGIKVGYLAQEPELDPSLDVAGNVLSGMGRAKQLVDRHNIFSAINFSQHFRAIKLLLEIMRIHICSHVQHIARWLCRPDRDNPIVSYASGSLESTLRNQCCGDCVPSRVTGFVMLNKRHHDSSSSQS